MRMMAAWLPESRMKKSRDMRQLCVVFLRVLFFCNLVVVWEYAGARTNNYIICVIKFALICTHMRFFFTLCGSIGSLLCLDTVETYLFCNSSPSLESIYSVIY